MCITNSIKFLPTQRDLKGLEAQVIRSRHNPSTYINVGKAFIEDDTMDGEDRATQETKPRITICKKFYLFSNR